MPVYRGIVKDNVVVLPAGVELADGAAVEVRPIVTAGESQNQPDLEELFKGRLLESGLIAHLRTSSVSISAADREPVAVKGPPLSETIIEERR